MQEVWQPVRGWEGLYEVSSLGRVKTVARSVPCVFNGTLSTRSVPERLKKQRVHPNGYWLVNLEAQGKKQTRYVHCLVAEAFLGPRPAKHDVCHGPAGQKVNTVENLRYGTRKENLKDRDRDGTHQRGKQGPGAKLTEAQVREIKKQKGMRTSAEVAADYGVSFSTVCMIWRGVTWTET